MLYLCYFLGHHRSKRWARPFAGTWRSECQYCGVRMERIGPGNWLPVSDLPKIVARSESKMPVAE